jgi:hypothetical protein
MRAARELEEPDEDEGFERIERIAFERSERPGMPGVFVAAAALERPGWRRAVPAGAPQLVFDWRPGESADAHPDVALCTHPGGPPVCWCRPPLPGLLLDFARRHGVVPGRSFLVGTSSAHRTLAHTLGARFVPVDL